MTLRQCDVKMLATASVDIALLRAPPRDSLEPREEEADDERFSNRVAISLQADLPKARSRA